MSVEKLVYKYLDHYVGEIEVEHKTVMLNPYTFSPEYRTSLYGKYGETVCQIRELDDYHIKVHGGHILCEIISNIFCLDIDISWTLILKWLLKKNEMTDEQELKKFIPDPVNS